MKTIFKKSLVTAIVASLGIAAFAGCAKKAEEPTVEPAETEITTETTETEGKDSELTEEGDFKSVTQLDLQRYVEVGNYKNLEVNLVDQYFIDDETLDYVLKQQISSLAPTVTDENWVTDRAVENGDVVNLDFAGYKDGEAFEGGTAEGYTLWIGSHSFIDGFEDGLIGVKPGETVDLNLKFPENYGNADLAGADVVFTCTVNGIITEEAIVDVFNSSTGYTPVENFDGIRDFWSEYYTEQLAEQYDADLENAIVNELSTIATYKADFPQSLIESYQKDASDLLDQYAQMYNTDSETLANQLLGISAEQFIHDNSYQQLQIDVVLAYIAEKEGFVLGEDALNARLKAFIEEAGYDSESEEVKDLDPEDYRITFLTEDVMDFLKDNVKVNLN